jgi:valyl-tRNA synthetase
MLGDTAVAVNPKDERYRDLHGRTVRLPLMDRDIPVILDELADPEFGTGVVKVTPAHDPNDFEAGKRHDLPHVKVIEETGRMTENAGRFAGLDRFEARRQVVAALDELGLLDKVEAYALSLGKCQRCATPVEPLVSTQWFVKMKPLAEPAIRAVEDGRIRIAPENSERVYFGWMRNIRDWCVSRQLWWGHRIPAWHCKQCGGMIVARQAPEQCSCGSADLEQDPDVLDTWFSSGLWPFSTLGWPDETEDLRTYYPTTLMIMGYEILFFWCARMIMMGLEFMKDVPFRRVYIHGIVRDAEKRKMSKTRGNTVDPMDIVEKYGTDAVRMALLTGAAPGSDVIWTEDRLPSARAFANKIWNAARFLFLKMEESGVQPWIPEQRASYTPETVEPGGEARIEDRWIFSRLNHCAGEVNRALDQYRYHEAAQTLWHFAWHEYCDWYVELKKLRFRKNSGLDADWRNALTAFEAMLRLLHPVTPFLTEELWQRLAANTRARPASVALARFPEYREEAADPAAESEMDMVQSIITAARHLRADMGLNPKQQVEAVLFAADEASEIGGRNLASIEKLATIRLELRAGHAPADVQGVKRSTTAFDLVLRAPVEQAEAQRKRLAREIEQLEKVIANSKRQLADEKFLSRAPEPVVNSIRQKLVEYQAQLGKSRSALETLAR